MKHKIITFITLLAITISYSQNIALSGTATSSSSVGGNVASNAVDGNATGTRWESESTDQQTWSVDLGASYDIGKVIIRWEGAFGSQYEIQVSGDNSNWTTIHTETAGNGGIDDITLSGTGRYVRYFGIDRGTPFGHSFWEFEVYEAILPVNDSSLSDLQIDGTSVADFSTTTFDYDKELSQGTVLVPTVIATTSQAGATAVVSPAGSLPGTTSVLVTAEDGVTTSTYTINFTVDQVNIAANKVATASTEVQSASLAFDENPGTRWESAQADPQWIYVDLVNTYNITGVQLNWEGAFGEDYTIEVSDDAMSWTTVFTQVGGDGGIDDITFTSSTGRYVRMHGTKRGTPFGYSLWEFEVYGSLDFVYDDTQPQAWSPNNPVGESTFVDNIQIVNGTALISGVLNANNVTVSAGATLDLDAASILNLVGDITNNGTILFNSDATGSAQLDLFLGSITGNITVERYIPAKRSFRLVSSPVDGQLISDAWQQNTHITGTGGATNGFDATALNNPSMFTFDNSLADQSSGAAWNAVTNTNSTNITGGKPYRLFVRGDRSIDLTNNSSPATPTTLSTTGTLSTGAISPTLSTTPNNFSFVGNPFQAVVNFGAATKSNLRDFIYVWDASIAGSNGNGGYVTVEVSSGNITAPSPSSSDASEFIAPGQAFFVQNTAVGNGSITFEQSNKSTSETQVSVFNIYTNFYINSRLYKTEDLDNGAMESDAIGLRFNENFTTLGSDEDASKLTNPGENYAIVNNGFRSIDYQSLPSEGHEVELFIDNYNESEYTLSFVIENKPEDLSVYLNDLYLNTQTELTGETAYNFTVDANIPASIDENRFKLVFEEESLNNQDFTSANVRLYPNPAERTLSIDLPNGIELYEVLIYNMLGQQVKISRENNIDISHLSSGVYLVEVNTAGGQVTKRIIKE